MLHVSYGAAACRLCSCPGVVSAHLADAAIGLLRKCGYSDVYLWNKSMRSIM
jgi:hypothetical protein